jgi:hypothetical protein
MKRCTKVHIPVIPMHQRDFMMSNASSSHLQDNWRARNNEKPLTVTRKRMY